MEVKFEHLLQVFDLLADTEHLETFLGELTEDQLDSLYSHELNTILQGELLP